MSTTQTATAQTENAYKVRREQLKELSRLVKLQMKEGAIDAGTVNEALLLLYAAEGGHTEFKTFQQWKSLGKSIIKGSKAFVIWGSPKEIPHPDPEAEDDEFKYWPLCYLFSDKQVTERRQS